MSVIIRDVNFQPIRQSRNLRGILEYMRAHVVQRVDIWPIADGGAQLGVAWADGATCITSFASFNVCKQWCAARRAFPAAVIHEAKEQSK